MLARRLLAALLLVVAGAGCRSQAPRPHDVVLIVADTLRADRLGAYGYADAHTPALDALAARGTRFAEAYAPSSWTVPSVASLMTSRLPSQHQVTTFDTRLREEEVTLAERLTKAGFLCGGATANWRLTVPLGFAQGFTVWDAIRVAPNSPGRMVRERALAWLDRVPDGAEPSEIRRFLYLQYMDTHLPYMPPPALLARYAPDLTPDDVLRLSQEAARLLGLRAPKPETAATLARVYDAAVATLDAELELLFDALEARGRLGQTLVIVTADHGEEFLEHGAFGHGYNLFNTTVHVPLIIAGPGVPAGQVIEEPVSLLDIAPTVLDLLGLPPEPRFEGRSLAPLLRNGEAARADLVLQLPPTGAKVDTRKHTEGLVRGTDKLIVGIDGQMQSYDLSSDPGEQTPLAPNRALHAALTAVTAERSKSEAAAETVEIDEATREQLRALGYAD